MSVFNDFFHVKQSPILSMLGFGGGGTGLAIGGGGGAATASGGTVHTPGNGYNYHVFIHSSTSTATSPDPISGGFEISGRPIANCDVLVVAGGGGGGSGYYGGGGGGSGVIVGTGLELPAGTYAIEVGNQGSKGLYPPGPSSGSDGGRSVFGDIILLGGGYGGSGPGGSSQTGSTTGSNAGGAAGGYKVSGTSNPYSVPSPYAPYGTWTVNIHDRPEASENSYGGDGAGGGAGPPVPGLRGGGVGVAVPQFAGPVIPTIAASIPLMGPTQNYYGGGGSGFNYPSSASGGFGGGGAGSPGDVANPATRYHLGGGGGGSGNGRGNGGLGGSGCVMVRVPV